MVLDRGDRDLFAIEHAVLALKTYKNLFPFPLETAKLDGRFFTNRQCRANPIRKYFTQCKKRLAIFPSPAAGCHKPNYSRPGKICLATSGLGDGKIANPFYSAQREHASFNMITEFSILRVQAIRISIYD
jgi:hypothetical protein